MSSEFAQSLSRDVNEASERIRLKTIDGRNGQGKQQVEAAAKAATIVTMKSHALRFSKSHLDDLFKTLQDTLLEYGYHVVARNVEEHADASGTVGKRLTAGGNTEMLASICYGTEFLTGGVTATSEGGGIIFRHEQIFTLGQFKADAVALWFAAQLRQAVVVMIDVGALTMTTTVTDR